LAVIYSAVDAQCAQALGASHDVTRHIPTWKIDTVLLPSWELDIRFPDETLDAMKYLYSKSREETIVTLAEAFISVMNTT
jgi:hypothetical protein